MILDDICSYVKIRYIDKLKDLDKIKNEAYALDKKNHSFYNALDKNNFNFIFEVKKASPSKGLISSNFDYINIAKGYESSGAACISVLTEPKYFLGSDLYLTNIKKEVNIPILRKDFILYEYQLYEARLIGADAVLLIAKILDLDTIKKYIKILDDLGLDYILEVHNKEELDKALLASPKVIGINNRDLTNFSVSLDTSVELRKYIKDDKIKVISESGIKTIKDLIKMKSNNINNYLIGEAVMS